MCESRKDRTSNYVCFSCGPKFLSSKQKNGEGSAVTAHEGQCGLCNKTTSITHIRAYNWLHKPNED